MEVDQAALVECPQLTREKLIAVSSDARMRIHSLQLFVCTPARSHSGPSMPTRKSTVPAEFQAC